jgi:hypothetical protein
MELTVWPFRSLLVGRRFGGSPECSRERGESQGTRRLEAHDLLEPLEAREALPVHATLLFSPSIFDFLLTYQ